MKATINAVQVPCGNVSSPTVDPVYKGGGSDIAQNMHVYIM